jgi:flagellar biosynthesis regulator FlaF
MFRCSLISLSLYCIKSSLTVLDSIARGFCVYNIVLFCTNSHYIWLISKTMPLTRMFRCSLISLSLYCIKSSLTVLDSIARGFCVYNIVLFCTNSHYIWLISKTMPLIRMFRCSLISLSLYCIKSSLTTERS